MPSAAQITDRAKRYRAQGAVTGKRACVVCGATGRLDVMHLDGNEAHGETANLAYGCRSCNGKLAAAFKKIGAGVPTNQYNPAKGGVPSYEQYAWAVSQQQHSGEHGQAGSIIHATPKSKRIEYAKRIARKAVQTKRSAHEDRWNPATGKWHVEGVGGISGVNSKWAGDHSTRDKAMAAARLLANAMRSDVSVFSPAGAELVVSPAKGKRNPAAASADVYEEFHGRRPSEVVTVSKKVHTHGHLAGLGKLTRLIVAGVDGKQHQNKSFGGALLCCNEAKNQLFIEGGKQAVDLAEFGISKPHEMETLGKLITIDYFTTKDHLGNEGGTAVYTHRLRTTNKDGRHVTVKIARYPTLIYDVVNKQLLISGGSYTIRAEGIDV